MTPPKRGALSVANRARDLAAVPATRPGREKRHRLWFSRSLAGRSMSSLMRAPQATWYAVTQSVATWVPFRVFATGLGAGGPSETPLNASERRVALAIKAVTSFRCASDLTLAKPRNHGHAREIGGGSNGIRTRVSVTIASEPIDSRS